MFDQELTQTQLAASVQRSRSRISELLTSLDDETPKQDRLSLLLDIASRLDLELLLAPRDRVEAVLALLDTKPPRSSPVSGAPSLFDEVFIDLGAQERDGDRD